MKDFFNGVGKTTLLLNNYNKFINCKLHIYLLVKNALFKFKDEKLKFIQKQYFSFINYNYDFSVID